MYLRGGAMDLTITVSRKTQYSRIEHNDGLRIDFRCFNPEAS
jgi:hypothetical protein